MGTKRMAVQALTLDMSEEEYICSTFDLIYPKSIKTTMTRSHQIAHRLRECILEGTWIANTNVKAQLQQTKWEVAEKKYGKLNTIAALAQHLHYYILGVRDAFENGELKISDKYSFDFAPMHSNDEWQDFQSRFYKDTAALTKIIEAMSDEELEGDFVDKKYGTNARNLEALIEHSYYHLGQIVMLAKILGDA